MPDGAGEYCRALTWTWFWVLLAVSLANVFAFAAGFGLWGSLAGLVAVPATFAIESKVRARRFSVVFHTSGSTGKSKDIVKPFATLAKEVAMHRELLADVLKKKPVFLSTIDPNHMYGTLWRVMLPAAADCPVDPEVILTPESLLAKMQECENAFLVTTPSFLERFTAYADEYEVPSNALEIVTSGALLKREVSMATKRVFGIAPREIFGSTETGGVAWRRQDRGESWSVFDPVKVSLSQGRIKVVSPFSFRRVYVMGDGAEMADDRRSFRLLGRMDRIVKINEERIDLAEMEDKVRAAGYRDAALVAYEGPRGARLGLVIAGESEPPLAVRSKLLKVFPKGTVPRKVRFVAELPRNPQGKVTASSIKAILETER
jgi:acyl-coenzyme A synthetase/AMP-(fatty) acid ligase